jgi:hypothetical protein
MKRTRFSSRERVSREAIELGRLAGSLATSGSRLEDRYWEDRLASLVDRLLQNGAEDDLNMALDRLVEAEPAAHDELADLIEARAESSELDHNGQMHDVLLVALPILAWSPYNIPSGKLPAETLRVLAAQTSGHLLAKSAHLALADYLFSPDQLPRSFTETWQMTRELGVAALSGRMVKVDPEILPETNRFLSDIRYLIGAVTAVKGGPLLRWQEPDGAREQALAAWVEQTSPTLEALLTGSQFRPLSLDAYHSAVRDSDRSGRPYAVQASVAFLQSTVGLEPAAQRAVIGPFYDRRLEEFRIGLGPASGDAVFHGIVWPMLGGDDDEHEMPQQIEEVLRACGVGEVVHLDHRFPFEFCDDCGAPLYPNAEGELVHAELPEQAESTARVLH